MGQRAAPGGHPGGGGIRHGHDHDQGAAGRDPGRALRRHLGAADGQGPARATGGFGVTEVSRVGVRLYVAVGRGGAPPTSFDITSITGHRTAAGRPVIVAHVNNTGGRAIDLSGTVRLADGPGDTSSGPFPAQQIVTLAPGQSWNMTFAAAEEPARWLLAGHGHAGERDNQGHRDGHRPARADRGRAGGPCPRRSGSGWRSAAWSSSSWSLWGGTRCSSAAGSFRPDRQATAARPGRSASMAGRPGRSGRLPPQPAPAAGDDGGEQAEREHGEACRGVRQHVPGGVPCPGCRRGRGGGGQPVKVSRADDRAAGAGQRGAGHGGQAQQRRRRPGDPGDDAEGPLAARPGAWPTSSRARSRRRRDHWRKRTEVRRTGSG